jgi:hypothetical protein
MRCRKDCIRIQNAATDKHKLFLVNCKIEPNDYTYRAQMITGDNMRKVENSCWKKTILNQASWKALCVNLYKAHIKRLPKDMQEAAKAKADECLKALMAFQTWNKMQTVAVNSLKLAPDSLATILGISGTGKTLMQQALVQYYYDIGLHVLVLALTNSNVDDMSNKLDATTKIEFKRLYSDNINLGLKSMRGELQPPSSGDASSLDFKNLVLEIQHSSSREAKARGKGFQQVMMDDALAGKYHGKVIVTFTQNKTKVPAGDQPTDTPSKEKGDGAEKPTDTPAEEKIEPAEEKSTATTSLPRRKWMLGRSLLAYSVSWISINSTGTIRISAISVSRSQVRLVRDTACLNSS